MTVTAPQATLETETPRLRKRRRPVLVGVVTVLVVAGLAAGVLGWRHRGPGAVPYADSAAAGRLALCDAHGDPVTEGSTADGQLAATVRGSSAVPAGPGVTATLFAYQPRQGAEPGEWSGLALTAASRVDGTAHAQLVPEEGSISLRQFLGGYPAQWDGWVQLRLLVGTADGVGSAAYDSLDVKVDGDHWQAVDPGTCAG